MFDVTALRQEQYSNKLSELTRPATQICHKRFKKPRVPISPKTGINEMRVRNIRQRRPFVGLV